MMPAATLDHTIVQNKTRQRPCFQWHKRATGYWTLTNGQYAVAIITADRAGGWYGEYCWREPSGGNKPTNWIRRATVQGCKNWIDRELRKFWNPPALKTTVFK